MTASRRISTRRGRRGLTLVEVLLVLALLVIMAGFTWPALERPIAGHTLRKAADRVRSEWIRTRVKAMSDGETYCFRCAAGYGQYVIECQAGAQPMAGELFAEGFAGSVDSSGASLASNPKEGSLPEGITFYADDPALDDAAGMAADGSDEPPLGAQVWSDPILFYPDGTNSGARLQLKNEYDRTIELTLRGLTGTVTVGELQSVGESPW
jgi:prepilin-type N-terminal cleavage/methylation domain-containing protein